MAAKAPNFTAVAPVRDVPKICTLVLGKTAGGLNPVILGSTLKEVVLTAVLAIVVTLIIPVVAPNGTVALIDVDDFTVKAALTPLKATLLTLLKLLPVIVTVAPTAPEIGVKLVILAGTGALIVRFTLVVWVSAPLMPVIISVEVPGTAEPVLTVSVVLLPALIGVVAKLPLAPDGRPLTLRSTIPLNPATTAVLTV